jgi:hypothetical protein
MFGLVLVEPGLTRYRPSIFCCEKRVNGIVEGWFSSTAYRPERVDRESALIHSQVTVLS